ncbi:antichymotrypsin-2 isoform X2 [Spodoptera frugiperda]|uniref:Antichymotrypsin-2 isoform X2 n=1 Tax=Spodoptera frugiperda TaxID=7108 RepID=A0A9R0DKL1_SPOFR|nr:antichymotrypsin-2 isoform X2 [Spodoptera frugiperda]
MRLYFILIYLGVIVSAKKHKHRSSDKDSTTEATRTRSWESAEHDAETITFVDTYLDLRGTMRKEFALEAAFVDHARNMICSPMSALMPLGKLALGAEGRSERELLKALGLESSKQLETSFAHLITNMQYLPGVTLDVASRVYVASDKSLNRKFEKHTKQIFKSSCQRIDTSEPSDTASMINNWVREKTRGKIKRLIEPSDISKHTSLILVNAIYFYGTWHERFTKTYTDDFHSASGTRRIPMMSREGTYNYYQCDTLNAQIVEIPYEGGQSSMIVVLPYNKNGLPVLLRALKLAPELLNQALEKMKKADLILCMPKFKIETDFDLGDLYKKVGVRSIFDPKKSKLTGIIDDETVHVSKAIHKAVIEVNEKGTEAAASSATIIVTSAGIRPKRFEANHPFYFMITAIKEQLFVGTFQSCKK